MGNYSKEVREIIDQNESSKRTSALKPAPPIAQLKRKPSDSMLWHLRHKPYQTGGDANAEQRDKGTKRKDKEVAMEIPGS